MGTDAGDDSAWGAGASTDAEDPSFRDTVARAAVACSTAWLLLVLALLLFVVLWKIGLSVETPRGRERSCWIGLLTSPLPLLLLMELPMLWTEGFVTGTLDVAFVGVGGLFALRVLSGVMAALLISLPLLEGEGGTTGGAEIAGEVVAIDGGAAELDTKGGRLVCCFGDTCG